MTKTARIQVHQEGESWWATSPDVPGWTAVASTEEELITLVDEASDFVPFKPYVRVYGLVPSSVYTWTN